jgi:hypothetical protein
MVHSQDDLESGLGTEARPNCDFEVRVDSVAREHNYHASPNLEPARAQRLTCVYFWAPIFIKKIVRKYSWLLRWVGYLGGQHVVVALRTPNRVARGTGTLRILLYP